MGPTDSPVVPVAYRERGGAPFSKKEKGVELLLPDGGSVSFWADDYAIAIDKARQAGYKV